MHELEWNRALLTTALISGTVSVPAFEPQAGMLTRPGVSRPRPKASRPRPEVSRPRPEIKAKVEFNSYGL